MLHFRAMHMDTISDMIIRRRMSGHMFERKMVHLDEWNISTTPLKFPLLSVFMKSLSMSHPCYLLPKKHPLFSNFATSSLYLSWPFARFIPFSLAIPFFLVAMRCHCYFCRYLNRYQLRAAFALIQTDSCDLKRSMKEQNH